MKVFFGLKFDYDGEWYGDYIECDIDKVVNVAPLMVEQTKRIYEAVIAQKQQEDTHESNPD